MLVNAYGPTETCAQSLCHAVTAADLSAGDIPIGSALPGEEAFVVDDNLRPLPPGETGQLVIGGTGVALGYHGRPGRSAQSFVDDPRPEGTGKVYLTGDLAQARADGAFVFRGRADRQAKIAGRRVEVDGVEHLLRNLPGVADVAVELVRPSEGAAHLAAFLVPSDPVADESGFIAALRSAATGISPEVFPRRVILCDRLALTPAGKIDRKALRTRLEPAPVPVVNVGRGDLRTVTAEVWQRVLGCEAPQAGDTFFDLGGTSLQLIEAHALLEQRLDLRFDITLLFETPRLADFAKALGDLAGDTDRSGANLDRVAHGDDTAVGATSDAGGIAIVGMAARLPGVATLDQFWEVIRSGRSVIERFTPEKAEDAYDAKTRAQANYVPARSVLSDVDQFDAKFFDMRPREAALTDPQGRVFLEICQQALDDAGIDPARRPGSVGVYAGASMSTYLLDNLLTDRDALRRFTTGFQIDYTELSGNDSDGIATRVAFKLGLTGPAVSVNTACSTSLVAIAQAMQALRAGAVDTVLAGGVSITFPQRRGYLHQEGGMVSPDGLCRPFDAQAGGTVFGHGAGVVVLRRLADAQADGDRILAVIRGAGLNNDGAAKMSYTAPSVAGQAGAIRAAHRDAGVESSQIGYVECHGTATPLGDPVEVSGLRNAFGEAGGQCALGSVKGNLGHLDAAAGVVSVIKTVLALSNREIPPVANFTAPNPRIDLSGAPFFLPDSVLPWGGEGPRLAGVSSFGVGGTNAHLVLQEAPQTIAAPVDARDGNGPDRPMHLPLSAKSPEALMQMAHELADRIEAAPDLDLADVAYTLQEGRRVFDWRAAPVAVNRDEAIAGLRATKAPSAPAGDAPPDVVFVFPGQGAQYPGMGSGLYQAEPEYARWIDAGAEILAPVLGRDIRRLILGRDLSTDEAAEALRETSITQPALFLTEYATARLWQARGIVPAAMIGHSVGEFAAAALAGVMSFEDALALIATRGHLMQDMPGGPCCRCAPRWTILHRIWAKTSTWRRATRLFCRSWRVHSWPSTLFRRGWAPPVSPVSACTRRMHSIRG